MSKIYIDEMIFYIFLLSIIFVNTNNKIYRIPFGQHSYEYAFQSQVNCTNIIESIFYNIIYINLSFGSPPQAIPFQLNINSDNFYVTNKYFFPNESNTFEFVSKQEEYFYNQDLKKGLKSKDYIYLDDVKKQIDFIYATEINKINNIGNIGLLIPHSIKKSIYSFFLSLKKAGIINSYSFTLKYYSDISILDTLYNYGKGGKNIGEFIIGDEPHNYEMDKTIYNESEIINIMALNDFDGVYWDIYFNNVYLNLKNDKFNDNNMEKMKVKGNHKAELNPDMGLIIGPYEIFSSINNIFFNKYKNICRKKQINNTYYNYIECDKTDSFNISYFPDITLESIAFETTFNLTYKDLFIFDKINNKYIFCLLNNRYVSDWILGAIFLRKYQFVFNVDKKIIGYYKSMNFYKNINYDNNIEFNNQKDQKENENTLKKDKNNIRDTGNYNNKKLIYIIIIGIILFLIFFFFFILLRILLHKKCFNNKRKKRVNELEDKINDISNDDNLLN